MKGVVFVENEELLEVFSRVIHIIDKGTAREDFGQALALLFKAGGAAPDSLLEKIFLQTAVAYCLGKYEQAKKPEQGPKTKEAWICGECAPPFN